MSQRTVTLELAGEHQLARDLVAGGVFVPGERLRLGEDCALVLRGRDEEVVVHATAVWVDDRGTGLQLVGCDADMKHHIAQLAHSASGQLPVVEAQDYAAPDESALDAAIEAEIEAEISAEIEAELGALHDPPLGTGPSDALPETDAEPEASEEERKIALNVNERLRGLTLVQQLKVAQHGEVSERIILERMYGKNVWEALLRNARITGPEVARIARMGALPRTLIEIIVGNGAWLQIPEVRRALLTNPRLGTDQIMRVLRLLPKHELKLAGMQTAYPFAVRDAAKRMLREMAGG